MGQKSLDTEMKEILKKNLPAHVGEVLKERLEQADKDREELEKVKTALRTEINKVEALNSKLSEYSKLDGRNATLEARESAITIKERSIIIEQLKYELQAEKDKTSFAEKLSMGLVRNTEYRRNLHGNVTTPGGNDRNGMWQTGGMTTNNIDETVKED